VSVTLEALPALAKPKLPAAPAIDVSPCEFRNIFTLLQTCNVFDQRQFAYGSLLCHSLNRHSREDGEGEACLTGWCLVSTSPNPCIDLERQNIPCLTNKLVRFICNIVKALEIFVILLKSQKEGLICKELREVNGKYNRVLR
jgi:hypothetical protein